MIDMSSIDPVESKKIGAELAEKGIDIMDAPVSGGSRKPLTERFLLWLAEKEKPLINIMNFFMNMAGSAVYVGPIGSGNVAKLANQIIVAVNIAAVSEALTLAKKQVQIRSLYIRRSAEALQALRFLTQKRR